MNFSRPLMSRKMLAAMLLTACAACATGCGSTRAYFVPNREPVRLAREYTLEAYVLPKGSKDEIKAKVKVYPGQWIVTDPGEDDKETPAK